MPGPTLQALTKHILSSPPQLKRASVGDRIVVGLAERLAAEGDEVLVVDLDPQANASMCFAGDSHLAMLIEQGKTIDAFIYDRLFSGQPKTFDSYIRPHISDVWHVGKQLPISLLASSPELRIIEREIIYELTKRGFDLDAIVTALWKLVSDQLKITKKSYDYVLFDCAPGISALTEVSIRLADLVIVPTIPDPLSTYGLLAFCNSVWNRSLGKNGPVKKPKSLPHVVITRRRPIAQHDQIAAIIHKERGVDKPSFVPFETEIPEQAAVSAAMGMVGKYPIFTGKWGDEIVSVLSELAKETKGALNGS